MIVTVSTKSGVVHVKSDDALEAEPLKIASGHVDCTRFGLSENDARRIGFLSFGLGLKR